MTPPISTINVSEYFDEVLIFLKQYQWIFNYPNTDVLVQNVFEKIPIEWLSHLKELSFKDLKDLALCKPAEGCPESLKHFLARIKNLGVPETSIKTKNISYNLGNNCGLGIKKQHELVSLAPIVAEICEMTGNNEVIDIGAGLGYLSHLMAEKHNFSVLAIEGSSEKIELAMKNQLKYHESSKTNVIFHHHYITDDSLNELKRAMSARFTSSGKICICGLHACADLSITILKLFLSMESIKSLVIMPCCYHRLDLEEEIGEEQYFRNFPVSRSLKSKFAEHGATNFLRRPFLRLACQQTIISFINMSEDEHRSHAEHFLMRAVLQKAADGVGCSVSRLRRKTGKTKGSTNSFEAYVENLSQNFELVPKDFATDSLNIEDVKFRQEILKIWESHKENLLLMEVLTALQTSIQSLCENILLEDSVQFLKENGVNCYIRKVTDDNISPRSHALIAIKE